MTCPSNPYIGDKLNLEEWNQVLTHTRHLVIWSRLTYCEKTMGEKKHTLKTSSLNCRKKSAHVHYTRKASTATEMNGEVPKKKKEELGHYWHLESRRWRYWFFPLVHFTHYLSKKTKHLKANHKSIHTFWNFKKNVLSCYDYKPCSNAIIQGQVLVCFIGIFFSPKDQPKVRRIIVKLKENDWFLLKFYTEKSENLVHCSSTWQMCWSTTTSQFCPFRRKCKKFQWYAYLYKV